MVLTSIVAQRFSFADCILKSRTQVFSISFSITCSGIPDGQLHWIYWEFGVSKASTVMKLVCFVQTASELMFCSFLVMLQVLER